MALRYIFSAYEHIFRNLGTLWKAWWVIWTSGDGQSQIGPSCGWNNALNFELWWSPFCSSFYTLKWIYNLNATIIFDLCSNLHLSSCSNHLFENNELNSKLAVSFVSLSRSSGKWLVFTEGGHKIGIDKYIKIQSDKKVKKFYLKGMIYHEGFHFVSVGKGNTVWFHDRQVCRNYIYEKMLEKFSSSNLQSCDRHTVSLVIYIHKNKLNWTHNCHAPAMALSSKFHYWCCTPTHDHMWINTPVFLETSNLLGLHVLWRIIVNKCGISLSCLVCLVQENGWDLVSGCPTIFAMIYQWSQWHAPCCSLFGWRKEAKKHLLLIVTRMGTCLHNWNHWKFEFLS
jgi:hypothetical protein